jgi:hypothetical protein
VSSRSTISVAAETNTKVRPTRMLLGVLTSAVQMLGFFGWRLQRCGKYEKSKT